MKTLIDLIALTILGMFGLVLLATSLRVVQIIYEVLFKKCEREQMGYKCRGDDCECMDGVEL
jgi:hypothetical protein